MRTVLYAAAAFCLTAVPAWAEPAWCSAAPQAGAQPFTVETPEGFTLEVAGQADDAVTWALRRGDDVYVGIYVGNNAHFAASNPGDVLVDDPRRQRRVRMASGALGQRPVEYLYETGCKTWPTQIHVWAHPLPVLSLEAERLAGTVKPK